ncbi:hypothetical protein [Motilibacter deserti]|uniref:Uncharacterized protein n=1 Tax=Motilibacter deserti TaxID=2714956 RepID=A0ABX0GWY5_9ACTN|nr:hypothetical protein [Motilibacter deserti]NHC14117.1 hypothetical protein [Motilibacter deserti]
MSHIVPTEGPDDALGHVSLGDPGEIPVEGGRARLPLPGDEDDAHGHRVIAAQGDEGGQGEQGGDEPRLIAQ